MGYDYRSSGSSTGRLDRPDRRPALRRRRHGPRLHRPRAGVQADPRRAVLRPGLVDVHRRAQRVDHLGVEVRHRPSRSLYETATRPRHRERPPLRPRRGRRLDRLPARDLHATYGCVTSWRQLYYDDAETLAAKYDLVNQLRPARRAAIWALGYDGTRTELYQAIEDKFITDTIPPKITGSALSAALFSPNADGRLDTITVRLTATGLTRWGWRGRAAARTTSRGRPVRSGRRRRHERRRTPGTADGAGRPAPSPTAPTGSPSGPPTRRTTGPLRPEVHRHVDTVRPVLSSTASRSTISPNGDGRYESTTVRLGCGRAGHRARPHPRHERRRSYAAGRSPARPTGGWSWDGTERGRQARPRRPLLVSRGRHRPAGNGTGRDVPVLVDRTIASAHLVDVLVRPRAGKRPARRLSLRITRPATVTVAIYQGNALVRRIWTNRALAAGDLDVLVERPRPGQGDLVAAGTYTVRVTTTSWIGDSGLTRTVTVKAG